MKGEILATIRDVARLANVSPTTVSATLSGKAPVSEELKKRVWAAVEEANYRPDPVAQNLRRGSTNTIGFIAPDVATPWAAHMARAAQRALSDRGYNMLLASNEDDPQRELRDIDLMISHRVAGLILAPTSLGDNYAQSISAAITCPAVIVDRIVAPDKFDVVADDNEYGGRLLAEFLLRHGHKRIGFLVGRKGISASDERHHAVVTTLRKANVELEERFVRREIHTEDGAYQAAQELMSEDDRPTALICISNPQVRGAMAGLANMGMRVPQDVSVVNFDGFNPPEGWSPTITCLEQDADKISDVAVELLLKRVTNADATPPQTVRIKPRLLIGNSCRHVNEA